MLRTHPFDLVFTQTGEQNKSDVTVCISLYNYQDHIVETLNSVLKQTHDMIDLVIVEDQSSDQSLVIALEWLRENAVRFNHMHLAQHQINQGLSAARNAAIYIAETAYVFILDADNLLFPRCIARCVEALNADPQASVAYPIIEKFGQEQALMGNVVWNENRFKQENCIDAMSLIRKQDLLAVGGYSELSAIGKLGWEDYELWCKFVERQLYGLPVPEILARYRTHKTSMLNSVSNQQGNIERLHQEMMRLHPWLELSVA